MREWCSCGAAIRSVSYLRVIEWRKRHVCPARPDEPLQVPPTGATSQVELSYSDIDMGARIGFRPNTASPPAER